MKSVAGRQFRCVINGSANAADGPCIALVWQLFASDLPGSLSPVERRVRRSTNDPSYNYSAGFAASPACPGDGVGL